MLLGVQVAIRRHSPISLGCLVFDVGRDIDPHEAAFVVLHEHRSLVNILHREPDFARLVNHWCVYIVPLQRYKLHFLHLLLAQVPQNRDHVLRAKALAVSADFSFGLSRACQLGIFLAVSFAKLADVFNLVGYLLACINHNNQINFH